MAPENHKKDGKSENGEKEIDTLLKNLEHLVKNSRTEIELKLDNTPVACVRLEGKPGGGIKAIISIKDFKKALANPALLKTALSLVALMRKEKGKSGKIDVEFESGLISRLFGK